ncbi:MAG: PfkB family carbohydrate kinase [Victivallaceae bacterium]|nr:PfkB family carbohydrate kinase [Victivallaceae bacterium]
MGNKIPEILIVGPNPSWQKTMLFDEFKVNAVNRASGMTVFASGKGINAARAAATWNQATARVLEFAGGENGRNLTARLQADNIAHVTVKTKSETRSCTTCLDASGGMTELIEPSTPVSADELAEYMAFFRELAPRVSGVIACGTAPGNETGAFYLALSRETAFIKCPPLLLDGGPGVEPMLESGKTSCLKVNAEELRALAKSFEPDATLPDMLAVVREHFGLEMAAVTDGPRPAYLATAGGVWQYTLPPLKKMVNPLGSGDSCNGVFWTEILRGTAPDLAFRFALSAASANCLTLFCGQFPVADAATIFADIKVDKL